MTTFKQQLAIIQEARKGKKGCKKCGKMPTTDADKKAAIEESYMCAECKMPAA